MAILTFSKFVKILNRCIDMKPQHVFLIKLIRLVMDESVVEQDKEKEKDGDIYLLGNKISPSMLDSMCNGKCPLSVENARLLF